MRDSFHQKGFPIIHVLTVHRADGSTGDLWMKRNKRVFLAEGTADVEEHPHFHRFDTDVVVTKTRHSAFIRTDLEDILRTMRTDAVVLMGFSTNACVGLTAIEAYERDFDVLLARDAILGCDSPRADPTLRYLRNEFALELLPTGAIMERITT